MTERRKLSRSHLVHYLRLFDQKTGMSIGNLIDVSINGIRLVSENPIEVGRLLSLRMDFPEEVLGKRWLTFDAACVWCRVDEDPNLYAAGCEFRQIASEDKEILDYLIQLYQDENP